MANVFCVFAFLVGAGGVAFAPIAIAAEIVVDNRLGSDLQTPNDGLRLQKPYRTITRAIRDAVLGDSITIRKTDEPYREGVSINGNHSLGTTEFPLVINGGGITLDGTRPLGSTDWDAMGRDIFEMTFRSPGHVKILAAAGQPTPENRGRVENLDLLQPFQFARKSGSIYFKTRRGDRPTMYGLRASAEQTGLTLYDVSNIIIRDMTIVGYRLDGINCHDRVDNVQFENVVSRDNGRSGISVGGASTVTARGCTFAANEDSQIRAEGNGVLHLFDVKTDAEVATAIDRAGGRVVEH